MTNRFPIAVESDEQRHRRERRLAYELAIRKYISGCVLAGPPMYCTSSTTPTIVASVRSLPPQRPFGIFTSSAFPSRYRRANASLTTATDCDVSVSESSKALRQVREVPGYGTPSWDRHLGPHQARTRQP
jgi:hypothetical protein